MPCPWWNALVENISVPCAWWNALFENISVPCAWCNAFVEKIIVLQFFLFLYHLWEHCVLVRDLSHCTFLFRHTLLKSGACPRRARKRLVMAVFAVSHGKCACPRCARKARYAIRTPEPDADGSYASFSTHTRTNCDTVARAQIQPNELLEFWHTDTHEVRYC